MSLAKGWRQFEPVGISQNDLVYYVWAEPFVVQLLHWTYCCDILSIEPDLVSDLVQWGFFVMGVVEVGQVIGCLGEG